MLLSDKYKITRVITKGTYSTLYEGEHIYKKHKVGRQIYLVDFQHYEHPQYSIDKVGRKRHTPCLSKH